MGHFDWTWGMAIVSIIGTIANAYRRRWGFVVWLVTNITWCVYDYLQQEYAQSALFGVYAILAVVGWVQWGREGQRSMPVETIQQCERALNNHSKPIA